MDLKIVKYLFPLFIVLSPIASANPGASEAQYYSQSLLLKNWVLCRCLAKAHPTDAEDAQISASAYLEFGKAPIEAYEEGDALVEKALSTTYSGSVKGAYNTMKCVDLFHGKEVEKLVRKYSKPTRHK